jgi:CBS domain-containing protein/anti-sigma regulatory factor (Ser/Thr protein kinase)
MSTNTSSKSTPINDQVVENISRVEELAYELKIDEVMTKNPKTLTPVMRMSEVLDLFRTARISGAPVLENGELLGIISIEDIIKCLIVSDVDAPVEKYMTPNPITIMSTDPVVEGLKYFVSTKLGRLIVVDAQSKMVGIITKGDINRGLLKALQRDYQVEELKTYRASHLFEDIESHQTSLILRYKIKVGDFTHGGEASAHIKRALLRLGANAQIARRVGIAVYEAEINLIIHTTNGGVIRVEIEPDKITIEANDKGPGIKDVDQALKPGFSTANEKVRELGFGAGMGLFNIKRCVDSMELESVFGEGTRLKMKVFLSKNDGITDGQK